MIPVKVKKLHPDAGRDIERLPDDVFDPNGLLSLHMVGDGAFKRFWSKVAAKENGCWEWKGAKSEWGYGYLNIKGIRIRAHRLSWLIHKGRIPRGMIVCHKCDNPSCVNIDHLFIGFPKDNSIDMTRKGRNIVQKQPEKMFGGKRPQPENRKRGEDHFRAKITSNDAIAIKRLYRSGIKITEISRRLNINYHTVSDVVREKTWRHVKEDSAQ